jgi:hypothetical protein
VPRITDNGSIPEVAEGSHIIRIEAAELIEDTAYQQPDVPETKLQLTFRVVTPGEEQVTFQQRVSLNLGDQATLGNIARAALRTKTIPRDGIDTDDLIGKEIDCTIGHSTGGWPKVVNQSAYPTRTGQRQLVGSVSSATEIESVPWDADDNEPPF